MRVGSGPATFSHGLDKLPVISRRQKYLPGRIIPYAMYRGYGVPVVVKT
jgi:hypothetical protein